MLEVQDSLLFRIMPRFLAVKDEDTVRSSTVTDRSMCGQYFPGWRGVQFYMVELEVMCSCPSRDVC